MFKDETCLVPEETTNINKQNVAIVEKIIENEIGNEDFIFVENLKYKGQFPAEVNWTDWLIYSAINKYGNKYNVIASNNVFKNHGVMFAKPIIVKKDLNVTKIDELKDYLKQKTKLDDESFIVYLKNNRLS